jgi:hypothetical protein
MLFDVLFHDTWLAGDLRDLGEQIFLFIAVVALGAVRLACLTFL